MNESTLTDVMPGIDRDQQCVTTIANLESLMLSYLLESDASVRFLNPRKFLDWLASRPPEYRFVPLASPIEED